MNKTEKNEFFFLESKLCNNCKKRKAEHRHHIFSNTKLNRKLYGKLLDDKKNIQYLCSICHLNKPLLKYTEKQFCKLLMIKIRSKTGLL